LVRCPWPGNVRELRNLIENAMIISRGKSLEIRLPFEQVFVADTSVTLEDTEYRHILSVLEKTGWRIKGANGAAELLGLKPATLYSRMKKLGLPTRTSKVEKSS